MYKVTATTLDPRWDDAQTVETQERENYHDAVGLAQVYQDRGHWASVYAPGGSCVAECPNETKPFEEDQ